MTKEELEKVVQGAEYDFLRENPHLGSNIMFLTLGGSHAYGTNVPGSDVDVRGVTGDSKYDLLGFGTFEQVVEQSTDTTIYGFRKLVSLLINCNPNVIEMLGSKPDNYLMVSPEGQMLLDNKALFLSKKALYSFGGYANDQLRRLQMGLLQNDVNTDMKEEFALRSVQRVLSGPDLQHNAPAEAENHFNISIGNVKDEEIKRQLVVNAALTNFPLRDFKSLIKAVNATVGQFDSLGKRNTKKDFPHMLSGMTRDNLVSYIASLTTVIFNLNYGRLMEKLDKCSNIEKIRLDNYKSKQCLARFDCTVRECDRDITPIIKTIKNTQEILYCKVIDGGGGYKVYNALSDADKYGEYFARTDIGAYTQIPTAPNTPRCRWTEGCFGAITDIEDAMVAKLKPDVNSPTSFNDYNLEFKRDMLPDSVEVKEYTMDNPDGIIL